MDAEESSIINQLKVENADLKERVIELEYKVLCQMEEIVTIKGILDDCVKRLDPNSNVGNNSSNSVGRECPSLTNALNSSAIGRMTVSHSISQTSPMTTKHELFTSSMRNSLGPAYFYRTMPAMSTRKASPMSVFLPPEQPLKKSLENRSPTKSVPFPSAAMNSPQQLIALKNNGKKCVPAWKPAGGFAPSSSLNGSISVSPQLEFRRKTRLSRQNSKKWHERKDEAIYIKSEGILRTFIYKHPIHYYVTSEHSDHYETQSVAPLPSHKLRLQWIYGYRGRDGRNNLHHLPTGEILYCVACVVVLYNEDQGIQRHYLEHSEEIKCMAVHPDRITVATGQSAATVKGEGKEAHIRVWSSVNLITLSVIGMEADFHRSILCIAFSRAEGGDLLSAVDDSQEHNLSIWDWRREKKLTETICSPDPVLMLEFHPADRDSLVSCGRNHLAFWKWEDNQLIKRQAIYDKCDKPKVIHCLAFLDNGDLATGDSSGSILIWKRGTYKLHQVIKQAHNGAILSICVNKLGHLISGGGRDARIVWWNSSLKSIDEEALLPEAWGTVRMIAQAGSNELLIGSTKNLICQVGKDRKIKVVVSGGHTDNLQCLATPLASLSEDILDRGKPGGLFLSGSHDGHLTLWDKSTHSPKWSRELKSPVHCGTFHPFESVIVIGSDNGRWIVIDFERNEMLAAHTDGSEAIQCGQFSFDGSQLALGSADGNVLIYHCLEMGRKFQFAAKCSGHSSKVVHIDWTEDGRFLRSQSADFSLLYWTSVNGRQVFASGQLRDKEWSTTNCTLSFSSVGIWSRESCYSSVGISMRYRPSPGEDTFVNASACSPQMGLLVCAESNAICGGLLKLFRFPAIQPKAKFHAYRGHSGEVTNVVLFWDHKSILSAGGRDCSIIQWEIL